MTKYNEFAKKEGGIMPKAIGKEKNIIVGDELKE
jgi:hypothetical protein